MANISRKAAQAALDWHLEHGVDEPLEDAPQDRTAAPVQPEGPGQTGMADIPQRPPASEKSAMPPPQAAPLLGKSDARVEAVKLAKQANDRATLSEAISMFDGLAIKKTATNMVFFDGNPEAPVMLVGEAPGADEDRQGKPFVGVSGQLLDKIVKCIDLDRTEEDPAKSIYISNILNWRPPGNRTPNAAEVEVSLPFIEKHIMLIQPKILILCGGVAAKALLGQEQSISRLRQKWHDYTPLTRELGYDGPPIPAIATYHPAYLLRTPGQKRAVWADMLMIQKKLKNI